MARKSGAKKKRKDINDPTRKPRPGAVKHETAPAGLVLDLIAAGTSLRGSCEIVGVKVSTFLEWVIDDREGLAERYTRALKIQATIQMSECPEIVDDGRNDWIEKQGRDGKNFYAINGEAIRRSELRMKWRQWYFEQASQGRLSFKRADADDGTTTAAAAVVAMLDAIANQKAAQA